MVNTSAKLLAAFLPVEKNAWPGSFTLTIAHTDSYPYRDPFYVGQDHFDFSNITILQMVGNRNPTEPYAPIKSPKCSRIEYDHHLWNYSNLPDLHCLILLQPVHDFRIRGVALKQRANAPSYTAFRRCCDWFSPPNLFMTSSDCSDLQSINEQIWGPQNYLHLTFWWGEHFVSHSTIFLTKLSAKFQHISPTAFLDISHTFPENLFCIPKN